MFAKFDNICIWYWIFLTTWHIKCDLVVFKLSSELFRTLLFSLQSLIFTINISHSTLIAFFIGHIIMYLSIQCSLINAVTAARSARYCICHLHTIILSFGIDIILQGVENIRSPPNKFVWGRRYHFAPFNILSKIYFAPSPKSWNILLLLRTSTHPPPYPYASVCKTPWSKHAYPSVLMLYLDGPYLVTNEIWAMWARWNLVGYRVYNAHRTMW